jgi:hypothetical protein
LVQFIPEAGRNLHGRTAVGLTGEDGSFHLQTLPGGTGALPGAYRVTVSAYTGPVTSVLQKYTQPRSSPLVVKIPPGGTTDLLVNLDP